jgi:hypothetical protein
MADYAKLSIGLTYSENSDYSNPRLKPLIAAFESTTATHYAALLMTVGTSAETVALDNWTTIESVIVKNNDTTNYVTVTASDTAATGTTDVAQRVAKGRILVLPDVTGGSSKTLTLQANTAACDCEIFIFGT